MKISFTEQDLKRLRHLTDINYHTESLQFVAKKINSPLQKELNIIAKKHNEIGYLPWDLSEQRSKLSNNLFNELRRKSAKQAEKVERQM
jgi:hypothetical protein